MRRSKRTVTSIDVKFQAHHWPQWGHDKIIDYWKKQRDLYKYIHDQSVNLMNKGFTGIEISNMVKLPPELDKQFYNRGYYGSVKHNTRAVYQRYMGFYDAVPATLDELPPVDAAKKYVEYMGGAPAILAKAKADFAKGEYRWTAEILQRVVFADPNNKEAKDLLADSYEQMGYQAESVHGARFTCRARSNCETACPTLPGRCYRKSGHHQGDAAGNDVRLFRRAPERQRRRRARKSTLVLDFTDLNQAYGLTVENGVLNHYQEARLEP